MSITPRARFSPLKAVRQIAALPAGTPITEQTVGEHLATSFMPDPDLLIRTGGELRISNFLLWQCAYSELYFCDTYWPDFMEADLHRAIADYQRRQRRYGKTEDQIEQEENNCNE